MPGYEIRKALPGDLEGIYRVFSLTDVLHRQAHPEIFKEVEDSTDIKDYLLAGIQAEDVAVFVTEDGGEIIGAIIASALQTRDVPMLVKRAYISVENIMVLEAFRQRGVGEALMERIHLWAEERGIKQIQLTVWDFNQRAQAFYKNLGYEMMYHRMCKELP